MQKNYMESRHSLPVWLLKDSNLIPPLYKQIWDTVQENKPGIGAMHGELLVDTNKVFPLLLTSQLPTDILGYIWSLANQKYSGQLSEQELYVVLALVAIAQASYTFNSLEILHSLPKAPIPFLNLALLESKTDVFSKTESANSQQLGDNFQGFESAERLNSATVKKDVDNFGRDRPNWSNSSNGLLFTTQDIEPKDNKLPSGNLSTVGFVADDKYLPDTKIINSSTDNDEFSEFQSAQVSSVPVIPMYDAKQGLAIGSRLANHNLGVKKFSDKAKKSIKSSHSISGQGKISSSSTSSGNSKDLTSSTDLFPKCNIRSQEKTVILKDTAIRSEPPKINLKPFRDVPMEKIINSIETEKERNSTFETEKTLPERTETSQLDLMSLQPDDKYSALRALNDSPNLLSSEDSQTLTEVSSSMLDDFGDFVSAEQQSVETPSIAASSQDTQDLLADFALCQSNPINKEPEISLLQEISETFNALDLGGTNERFLFDDKCETFVESGPAKGPKEDATSVNSMDLGSGMNGPLTRSGSVPSLDLNLFLPSNSADEQFDNMHQLIYWEWKQYMECCVVLLQVAANIFMNINSEVVMSEVLSSAQGYNFLCNLAEVAAVCRRVNYSHKEMDINIMGFDDLLMDIDRLWAEMEPFYTNIPIVTEIPSWPSHKGESLTCSLCLTVINSGRVIFNDNNYHATCANLWLNCVNGELPTLSYPIFPQISASTVGSIQI